MNLTKRKIKKQMKRRQTTGSVHKFGFCLIVSCRQTCISVSLPCLLLLCMSLPTTSTLSVLKAKQISVHIFNTVTVRHHGSRRHSLNYLRHEASRRNGVLCLWLLSSGLIMWWQWWWYWWWRSREISIIIIIIVFFFFHRFKMFYFSLWSLLS